MSNFILDAKSNLFLHFKSPKNYGILKKYDFLLEKHNYSCGDSIKISAQIECKKIIKFGFEAKGCMLSIASASIIGESIILKSLDSIQKLQSDFVLNLINLQLGPNRLNCCLFILDALKEASSSFLKNQNKAD